MKRFSVIIPSKNVANLKACLRALREAGETATAIIVDDGLDFGNIELREFSPLLIFHGQRPFIFARNVNAGIQEAGTDDVVLMNDDAILQTRKGLSALATQAAAHPEYGAICPGFDHCGTPNLVNQGRRDLAEERIMLIFACCFIPRSTIDAVGLLDERFAINAGGKGARGYGLEDDDYSLRIRQNGLKLGVYDPVMVHHTKERTGLSSTFRDDPEHPWDVKAHEELFRQKHGVHPRLQGK